MIRNLTRAMSLDLAFAAIAMLSSPQARSQMNLPDAPTSQASPLPASQAAGEPSLKGTPKRIFYDEVHVITSPAHVRSESESG